MRKKILTALIGVLLLFQVTPISAETSDEDYSSVNDEDKVGVADDSLNSNDVIESENIEVVANDNVTETSGSEETESGIYIGINDTQSDDFRMRVESDTSSKRAFSINGDYYVPIATENVSENSRDLYMKEPWNNDLLTDLLDSNTSCSDDLFKKLERILFLDAYIREGNDTFEEENDLSELRKLGDKELQRLTQIVIWHYTDYFNDESVTLEDLQIAFPENNDVKNVYDKYIDLVETSSFENVSVDIDLYRCVTEYPNFNITNLIVINSYTISEPTVTVTFESTLGNKIASFIIEKGRQIFGLPEAENGFFKFLGWKDTDGNIVDDTTTFEEDTTVVGEWDESTSIYSVTLHPGLDNENTLFSKNFSTLPQLEKEGYTFLGWFTEAEGGEQVLEGFPDNSIVDLYAHWQENEIELPEPVFNTISFYSGDELIEKRAVEEGTTVDQLPSPSKDGYKFQGWVDDTQTTISEIVASGDADYFAVWEELPQEEIIEEVQVSPVEETVVEDVPKEEIVSTPQEVHENNSTEESKELPIDQPKINDTYQEERVTETVSSEEESKSDTVHSQETSKEEYRPEMTQGYTDNQSGTLPKKQSTKNYLVVEPNDSEKIPEKTEVETIHTESVSPSNDINYTENEYMVTDVVEEQPKTPVALIICLGVGVITLIGLGLAGIAKWKGLLIFILAVFLTLSSFPISIYGEESYHRNRGGQRPAQAVEVNVEDPDVPEQSEESEDISSEKIDEPVDTTSEEISEEQTDDESLETNPDQSEVTPDDSKQETVEEPETVEPVQTEDTESEINEDPIEQLNEDPAEPEQTEKPTECRVELIDDNLSVITIPCGTSLTDIPSRELDGFIFSGWFDDENNQLTENTLIDSDQRYSAQWIPVIHTIKFVGEDIIMTVNDNYPLSELPVPVKDGYKFIGWFKDETLTEQVTSEYVPDGDLLLYPKWIEDINGWKDNCYYENGVKVIGQKRIGEFWYYFNSDGTMAKGFVTIPASQNDGKEKTVYYDENGHMIYGAHQIGKDYYFFKEPTGEMVRSNFVNISKDYRTYYNDEGKLVKGQYPIKGDWYYFDTTNGNMYKGWKFIEDQQKIVYYNVDGKMLHGKHQIGNASYTFNQTTGGLSGKFIFGVLKQKYAIIDSKAYPINSDKTIDVLFIGNSMFYRPGKSSSIDDNSLPGQLKTLANSYGVKVNVKMITVGGRTIQEHWTADSTAQDAIKSGKYEIIILQEQSDYSGTSGWSLQDSTKKYFKKFVDLAKKTNAEVFIYSPAAKYILDGKKVNGKYQSNTDDNMKEVGKYCGVDVIYAGKAIWEKAASNPSSYFASDGYHPTAKAQKIAADAVWNEVGDEILTLLVSNKSTTAVTASQSTPKSGWDGKKYYKNGKAVVGQQKIGEYWYYFNKNGDMVTGFTYLSDDKKKVYYDSKGRMLYGRQKIDGNFYHFDEKTGEMTTGWFWDSKNSILCYYKSDGKAATGNFSVNGVKYWADANGSAKAANVSKPYTPNLPFTQKGTNAIVNVHRYDFNSGNFDKIIKANGGYNNYIKSLGGVFTKWANKNTKVKPDYTVKSVTEFQECADYVFGIMTMYGFNYTKDSKVWGSQDGDYADDAFYQSKKSYNNVSNGVYTTIDQIASGNTKGGMYVNCGFGVTYIYRKAGIIGNDKSEDMNMEREFYNNGSKLYNKYYRKNYDATITDSMSPKKFKVGDIIGFYVSGSGFTYRHVAIVVAVNEKAGTYTLYDSGSSKFTKKRGNNLVIKMSDKLVGDGGVYSGYSSYKVMRLGKDYKGNKIPW